MTWTNSEAIVAKVQRAWDSGALLRSYALREEFPKIDMPLRGPSARDLASDLNAAQSWAEELRAGSRESKCYDIVYGSVGGKSIGRNQIPKRAQITSFQQTWTILRVTRQVEQYETLLAFTADEDAHAWALAYPLKALAQFQEWPTLLSALAWLREATGSGKYVREVSAPGVDTKFIERHRSTLAAILGVPSKRGAFEAALGLATPPVNVQMRYNYGDFDALPGCEVTLRMHDANDLAINPRLVLIIENQITYLSVPVPNDCIVIWGRGLDVSRLGALNWLGDVIYWGDLDTAGFGILNQLRSHVPQVRSALMDVPALLESRERWGKQPDTHPSALPLLTDTEREAYDALVTNTFDTNVRLEQERIDWDYALFELAEAGWNDRQPHLKEFLT